MQNLKEGEFVLLVVDSGKRCVYKLDELLNYLIEVKKSKEKAHEEQNRPVMKLAPVFYDGVPEFKYRQCWFHFKSKARAMRQQELSLELEKKEFVKTQND